MAKVKIYIDTNIIKNSNYLLRASLLLRILRIAKVLNYRVAIPAVVLDEIKEKYSQDLKDVTKGVEKACKLEAIEGIEIEHETILENFIENLSSLLDKLNVEVLDYPSKTPEEIVKASYKGEKPFKADGEGFKDYLIWQSILEEIKELPVETKVYFITSDGDFNLKKEGKHILHPDLAQQIPSGSPKVTLFVSEKHFYEDTLEPLLERVETDDIPDLGGEELVDIATEKLGSALPDYHLDYLEGFALNDITVLHVESSTLQVSKCLKADEDTISIFLDGEVELEVSGYIDKHEYHALLEDKNKGKYNSDIDIDDANHNDHVMSAYAPITVPVEVTLSYSKPDETVDLDHFWIKDELNYHDM